MRGFQLYLVFVLSWFLHLPARVPFLGLIRFDLLLVAVLATLVFLGKTGGRDRATEIDKWLRVLVIYSLVTIPFVEWPGSVIRFGIEGLVKGVVFYYFTVAFVDSESRLKTFLAVFVGCQLFRVMEPLYLHIANGYWGSVASQSDWEYLNRLSGAPYDVVNPNGLAFVICTVLPFLWFAAGSSWLTRVALVSFAPACIYALMLTGSRTGFLGLIVVALGVLAKAKRRFALALAGVLIAAGGFPLLNSDLQDRYLSIFGRGEKNAATAEARVTGVLDNFEVAFRRPLFGHGLGTSREANANFGQTDQPAHNLYAEAATELGFIGMVIFIFLILSIFAAFVQCKRIHANTDPKMFVPRTISALQVWLLVSALFSFASYGVSSYEWYLLGGLAVAVIRVTAPATTVLGVPGASQVREAGAGSLPVVQKSSLH